MLKRLIFALIFAIALSGMTKYTIASTMVASWYDCCARTANGEKFNPNGLTAAHKTLPFGTKLRVTYNHRSVIVRINDRGPFVKGRQLDLSRGAARKIKCPGVCTVKVEILK